MGSRIYLSSSFLDLQAHRQAVWHQLVQMNYEVVAMENYVARDDRPVAKCVQDVIDSDLYVGLLAWRYGYIPTKDNPESLSVTEFEYRAAKERKKPTLFFLLDEAAEWKIRWLDSQTGEGAAGARIRDLRKRVAEEHTVAFFTSPDVLARKVAAAVHVAGAVTEAPDASLDLSEIVSQDAVDNPEMLFNQSYTPHLIRQLGQLGNAKLLKIDLRDGAHWWSTRLYALATLAHEYTEVEWILLLEAGDRYVGMVRPNALRRALVTAQPELEEHLRAVRVPPSPPGDSSNMRAGAVLQALVDSFASRPGGEASLRFIVNPHWIAQNVPGLSTAHVEMPGAFDPLAVFKLLDQSTPFVPIVQGTRLLKVIDRLGVATEIARTSVERRLGRG